MNTRRRHLCTALALGLGLVLALLWQLGSSGRTAVAAPEPAPVVRPPSDGTPIHYVAPSGADDGDCGTPGGACLTIQYALDQAGEDDEIRVAAGIYAGVSARAGVTQVLYVDKPVTVRGGYTTTNWTAPHPVTQPTVVDAQGQGRAIYINSVSSTIEGLHVTGGDASGLGGLWDYDAGGGIYANGARVAIGNVWLFGNTAYYGGGALFRYATVVLEDSNVFSNTASYGGGLYVGGGNATLGSNTLLSNTATWAGGAAMLADSDITLGGNVVVSNSSGSRGGGLSLWFNEGALSENTIAGNDAGFGGGADQWGGDVTYAGNAIRHNAAHDGGGLYLLEADATLIGNLIQRNSAQNGGGVALNDSDPTLDNNVVTDNQASSDGAGIHVGGSSPRLRHTTLARNAGSGVYVSGGSHPALFNTIVVSHNTGIYVASGSSAHLQGTLWGASVWSNSQDWAGSGTIDVGPPGSNYWGDPAFVDAAIGDYHILSSSAAVDAGVNLSADDLTSDMDGDPRPAAWGFDLGADERPGPGLFIQKIAQSSVLNPGQAVTYTIWVTGVGTVSTTDVFLTDTLPARQRGIAATADQGGCIATDTGATCDLGCVEPGDGRQITLTARVTTTLPSTLPHRMRNTVWVTAAEAANTTYLDTHLQDCHARLNSDPAEHTTIQAAVDASSHPTDVVRVAGICAGVNRRGGLRQQVYLSRTLALEGGWNVSFTLRNPLSTSTRLDALGLGRVFYVAGDAGPIIEGFHITGGKADGLGGRYIGDAGGGMYIIHATALISANQVSGNSADHGAGVYMESSASTLAANAFSGNEASEWGGGINIRLCYGATIRDSSIVSNSAECGGGLHMEFSDSVILSNTISANSAGWAGGGVHVSNNGSGSLVGNRIAGNHATAGGGAYLLNSRPTFEANSIIANTTGTWGEGGGLYLDSNSNAVLANNVVADNYADSSGGALYVEESSPTLLHTTIAHNPSGNGSGVYVGGSGSTASLSNSIIANHPVGIRVASGSTAILDSTLWDGNGLNWIEDGTLVRARDYFSAAGFVNPAAGDYHIGADSAAIDRGVDVGASSDLDGDWRPQGHACDIGADEFRIQLAVSKQAGSSLVQPDEPLVYTIHVTNTGDLTLTATITDVLPAQVTPSGVQTWTATLPVPDGVWTGQLTVTLGVGYGGTLTNGVLVASGEGATGSFTHTVVTWPMVDFSSATYEADEGAGAATISATLSHASPLTATVQYATDDGTATKDSDYTAVSGTLVFTPGVTARTFTVLIADDGLDEYDEGVVLTLSDPTSATVGSSSPATLTIRDDDDPPTLSIGDRNVIEGNSGSIGAVFAVTLSAGSGKPITVAYATADGSATAPADYTAVPTTTLAFGPGTVSQTISVSVHGDAIDEIDEVFWVNLAHAVNATIGDGQGQCTIEDDDGPAVVDFSATGYVVHELSGMAIVTVTLDAVCGLTATVDYAVSDLTATAGEDYTAISGTLTFTPGITVRTFAVPIIDDATDEDDETADLTLSNADNAIVGGISPATLTILDDDVPPGLSIGDAGISEGDFGSAGAVLSVTLSAASGKPITVTYATADGSATAPTDYTAVPATPLVFAPGTASRTITVAVLGDTEDEYDESFWVHLTAPLNASIADPEGAVTILDDDALPTVDFDRATYSVDEGAGVVTATVTLSAQSAKTVTVAYTTSDGTATAGADYVPASGTLTFAPGVTSKPVAITITDDGLDEASETVELTLSNASNATIGDNNPATLLILDDDPAEENDFLLYLPVVLHAHS